MPSFNEAYFGYPSFSRLLEDAAENKLLQLTKEQKSGGYIVSLSGDGTGAETREEEPKESTLSGGESPPAPARGNSSPARTRSSRGRRQGAREKAKSDPQAPVESPQTDTQSPTAPQALPETPKAAAESPPPGETTSAETSADPQPPSRKESGASQAAHFEESQPRAQENRPPRWPRTPRRPKSPLPRRLRFPRPYRPRSLLPLRISLQRVHRPRQLHRPAHRPPPKALAQEKVLLRPDAAPPAVAGRGLGRKPRAILSPRLNPHHPALRPVRRPGFSGDTRGPRREPASRGNHSSRKIRGSTFPSRKESGTSQAAHFEESQPRAQENRRRQGGRGRPAGRSLRCPSGRGPCCPSGSACRECIGHGSTPGRTLAERRCQTHG